MYRKGSIEVGEIRFNPIAVPGFDPSASRTVGCIVAMNAKHGEINFTRAFTPRSCDEMGRQGGGGQDKK